MSDEDLPQMQLFPLTDEEWRERSKRLASTVAEYKRVDDEKKVVNGQYLKTLKGLRVTMETLADAVAQGKEWRELLDGDHPFDGLSPEDAR